MSLSIGVVNITYLEQPGQPTYRFMQDLMAGPGVGLGVDLDDADFFWDGGGRGENAFYEFTRDGLINRANGWATEQNLSSNERLTLINWIENLFHRDEYTMLHLGI